MIIKLGAGQNLLLENNSNGSMFINNYLLPKNGTTFQFLDNKDEKTSLEANFNVKKIENFIRKEINLPPEQHRQ